MKKLSVIASVCAALCCLPSCESEECPANALPYAHFSLVNQYGQSVSYLDTITVIGQIETADTIFNDTIINRETNVSSLSLPLGYADETAFTIVYNNTYIDRFTVHHRNIPYFLNLDCGTMMFHEITDVTGEYLFMMDSIAITNPNIDNNEKENFKIYFTVPDEN